MFPRNTPRAHRATELAKEFSRQGYDVKLYALLGKYNYKEFEKRYSVKVENLGDPMFYPIKSDGEVKVSVAFRLFSKILKPILNFPEIELMPLVKKVISKESKVDILITNAIPHALHWGAAWSKSKNKAKFPKVWFADCGDPFMGNQFRKPFFYFKYLEKWFCKKCDFITVPIEEAKNAYYHEYRDKIKVIPQGFQFNGRKQLISLYKKNTVPHFLFAGAFYPNKRDPREFLKYLVGLDMDFKFIVYTRSVDIISEFLKPLGNKLEIRDYIPREHLLKEMAKMDFLINIENSTSMQSPSKLIDYYLTNRPVLSLPNNTAPNNTFLEFLNGNYKNKLQVSDIEQYNIENVVKKFETHYKACLQNI